MTHRPELLSAMLDGEATETEAAWIRTHLDECGHCRAELEDLAFARAAVRGLPMLDLPDDLRPSAKVVVGPWGGRVVVTLSMVAAAAVVTVAVLGLLGLAEDQTHVDVTAAEEILAATAALDLVSDGSPAAELLVTASDANYRARITSACVDDQTVVESAATVTRNGDVTVMADALSHLTVVTDGAVSTGTADGPIRTVTVTGDAPRIDGYSVASVEVDHDRDRPTEVVTLVRDGVERVRLWVDIESGAIVHRQLLSADGEVACVTELTGFEPVQGSIQASIPFDIRAEVTETVYSATPSDLPDSLGGLDRVAAYAVDGGTVVIYGDGVMLVAVLQLDGGAPTLTEGARMPVTVWEANGSSWAIVGAVPPDVRAAVAADLPGSDGSNPITDGWRRLFG